MNSRLERGYLPTSDGLIHYASSSVNPSKGNLVLLHQISGSARMFESLMPLLAQRGWSSLAIDMLGFGMSDAAPMGFGVEDHTDAMLEAIAVFYGAGAVTLVGHHTGARLAAVMAANHPERVQNLIVMGLPLYRSEQLRETHWQVMPSRRVALSESGDHLLYEWNRLRRLDPEASLATIQRELVDTLLADSYVDAYEMVRRHRLDDIVGRLRCPVLFIAATSDPLIDHQEYAASRIRGAEFVTVEGATYVIDDKPDRICELVVDFVESRDL